MLGFIYTVFISICFFREMPEEYFNNSFTNVDKLKEVKKEIIQYKRMEIEKVILEERDSVCRNLMENLIRLRKKFNKG